MQLYAGCGKTDNPIIERPSVRLKPALILFTAQSPLFKPLLSALRLLTTAQIAVIMYIE
jgi:hypothetical protein